MRRFTSPRRLIAGTRVRRFLMGIAAGLTAQGIVAFWRWLRAPAIRG